MLRGVGTVLVVVMVSASPLPAAEVAAEAKLNQWADPKDLWNEGSGGSIPPLPPAQQHAAAAVPPPPPPVADAPPSPLPPAAAATHQSSDSGAAGAAGAAVSGGRAAVLLASHAGPMVVSSVLNALGVLPPAWRVHVFGTTPAVRAQLAAVKQLRAHTGAGAAGGRAPPTAPAAAAPAAAAPAAAGRLTIDVLRPQGGTSVHDRPSVLTSAWFWRQCPEEAEHLLLVDETTRLCAAAPKTVDDFVALGFAYVGAPWSDLPEGSALRRGGNGMLSLRRRSAMLAVLAAHTHVAGRDGNEDMWFAERLVAMQQSSQGQAQAQAHRFKLPHPDVSRQFAVETVFFGSPVGVSYAMRTLTTEQRGVITTNCPEARQLVGYLPGASWLADVRSGGAGDGYSLCAAKQKCCSEQRTEVHWRTKKPVPLPPCPVD